MVKTRPQPKENRLNWLWPARPRATGSLMIRAGRVAHWCFVAAAFYAMIFAWVAMYTDAGEQASVYKAVVSGLIMAMPLLLIGRAVRYVMAAE